MGNDTQITQTFIGWEYGWDYLSQVDAALLRNNREAKQRVLTNPDKFPWADFDACRRLVDEIDAFEAQYPETMGRVA